MLMSCGAPDRPLSVGELLDLGDKYLRELDYEQAIMYYTRVIEVEPNNVRAYIGRGDAYTALQRYDEAVSDYKRVIEIDPGIPEVYIKLADVYIAIGDTGQAMETLRSGLASLPGNSELQSRLDELRHEQNSPGSIDAFDTVPESRTMPGISDTALSAEGSAEPSEASDPRDEETQIFLKNTLTAYETEGYDGIYSAIETSEYAAIIENDPAYPVIYLDESGIYGSGIYKVESGASFMYIGDYANGLRSGHGIWVGLWEPLYDGYYRFEGEWANDKPYGAGIVEQFDPRVDNTYTGYLIDGLWDGEVLWIDTKDDPNTAHLGHMVFYEKGKYKAIGEAEVSPFDGVLRYPIGYQVFKEGVIGNPAMLTADESQMEALHGVWGFTPRYQG